MAKTKAEQDPIDTSENDALRKQNDQVIDMLVEMQAKLDALEAKQGTAPAAKADTSEQAKYDAELQGLMEEFKDYPAIKVFERRVLTGVDASVDIRLKGDKSTIEDPSGDKCKWKLRWFNFDKPGQSSKAEDGGWMRVLWEDVADQGSIHAAVRMDAHVRRGDKGLEVLHKIPLPLYSHKKRREAAVMSGKLSSESSLRDYLANGVANLAGKAGDNADQAGTAVSSPNFTVSITPGPRETVTL